MFTLTLPRKEDDKPLADWCEAVRHGAAATANTAQGLRGWTRDQQKKLQAGFHVFTPDRDERLAMGNFILTTSGLTGRPLTSFNDLSEAQASALIVAMYGRDTDSIDILADAFHHLEHVLIRVRWQRATAEP